MLPVYIFMDLVVYGSHKHCFHYTDVVAACIVPHERGSDAVSLWMKRMPEERRNRVRDDFLRLSNELLKMFIQKGKDERDGVSAPGLMARCRYHSHMAKGQPCYMDK